MVSGGPLRSPHLRLNERPQAIAFPVIGAFVFHAVPFSEDNLEKKVFQTDINWNAKVFGTDASFQEAFNFFDRNGDGFIHAGHYADTNGGLANGGLVNNKM